MDVPSFLKPKNTPDILFSSCIMAWPTQTEAADPEFQTLILILTNELVDLRSTENGRVEIDRLHDFFYLLVHVQLEMIALELI